MAAYCHGVGTVCGPSYNGFFVVLCCGIFKVKWTIQVNLLWHAAKYGIEWVCCCFIGGVGDTCFQGFVGNGDFFGCKSIQGESTMTGCKKNRKYEKIGNSQTDTKQAGYTRDA